MKRVYPLMFTVSFLLTVITIRTSYAQCTCWTGLPATPVVETFTLAPTSVTNASIIFPQFDPSIGTLSCMKFDYKISAQSTTGVKNLAPSTALLPTTNPDYSPTGRLEYIFNLLTSANITGPSLSITKPYNTTYGPDSLGAYGQPDDTITYGPNMVINNVTGSKSFGGNAAYLGHGNVSLSYGISGGLSTIKGGLNFNQRIQTIIWGDFTLTYYWCPAQPLATTITNFTAIPNGNGILLQWLSNNEQNNIQYEIEISTDGKQFTGIGTLQNNPAATGTTAKYQYQYNLNQVDVGKLYFRIRQTDISGKLTYSPILAVTPGGKEDQGPLNYQTYPNPATNTLNLLFSRSLAGRYSLELVNTAGQVILHKNLSLSGTNQVRWDLNPQPPRGLYFLRVTDLTSSQEQVNKVFISQ